MTGTQVTVDLAGGARVVDRVNVSALLQGTDNVDVVEDADNQSRFSALRQFELKACSASCSDPASFTTFYTSPSDAFPGAPPRPVTPDLNLRNFDVPNTTATHLRLVVAEQPVHRLLRIHRGVRRTTPTRRPTAGPATGPVPSVRPGGARGRAPGVLGAQLAVTQTNTPKPQPTGGGSGGSTPTGPGAALPDPPPALTRLSLSNRRFRRGSALPRAAAAPKGTVIRFRLSEAARVTYTFRRRAGRRYVRAGTLRRAGRAGRNRLRFYGRLSRRRALRPGAYRLVVVATDSAGQRSARRTASFTLLAR